MDDQADNPGNVEVDAESVNFRKNNPDYTMEDTEPENLNSEREATSEQNRSNADFSAPAMPGRLRNSITRMSLVDLDDEEPPLLVGSNVTIGNNEWDYLVRGDVNPTIEGLNFEINNRARMRDTIAGSSGDGLQANWQARVFQQYVADRQRLRPRRRTTTQWRIDMLQCVMRGAVLALALSFWAWRGPDFWSCMKSASRHGGVSATNLCVQRAFHVPGYKMPWVYAPMMFGLTMTGSVLWMNELWEICRLLFYRGFRAYLPGILVSGQLLVGQFMVAHPPVIKRRLVQPPARAVFGLANPQPTKLRFGCLIVGAPKQSGSCLSMIDQKSKLPTDHLMGCTLQLVESEVSERLEAGGSVRQWM
ncbi:unnamed protein product [Notodromas monacha]|uniref:Uncharacterized protein n=1 Tax=Notodromas monacha TaxID=399045 RepID=A0A7R9GHD8_9CRUS|nr:unnamed protein product [Notodromas monacha]CAG0922777.1 unnamed protein product [Notodromas monacha]